MPVANQWQDSLLQYETGILPLKDIISLFKHLIKSKLLTHYGKDYHAMALALHIAGHIKNL